MKRRTKIILSILGLFLWITSFIVLDMDFQRIMFNDGRFGTEFHTFECDTVEGVYKKKEDDITHILIICETDTSYGTNHFLVYGTNENFSIYARRFDDYFVPNLNNAPEEYREYLDMFDQNDEIFTLTTIGPIRFARYSGFIMFIIFVPAIFKKKKYK